MTVDVITDRLQAAMKQRRLDHLLAADGYDIFEGDGEYFISLTLVDAAGEEAVTRTSSDVLNQLGIRYTLSVKSRWAIDDIGDLIPAKSPDGGIRAAVLIPVRLRSGSVTEQITISVTKLAEENFKDILRRTVDMKEVALAALSGELQHGGRSRREVAEHNYLEINANAAVDISRLLRKTA